MKYKHLSQVERYQIYSLLKAQHSITQIAQVLARDKSTISRELRRNAGARGYRAQQACELAQQRAQSSRNASTIAPWVREQALALLQLQWSPQQIASQLPISQRPAHIEQRKQIGHWQCDTVIGANHKQAIVTAVERKSGYAVIAKVSNKTAELVSVAIINRLKPFEARVKTLTYDNGKEFCGHAKIDQALNSTGYFARPFASWERGTNENFNGLLRQYIPKKRSMENITDEEIKMIESRLNNRPRRRLGFKTPAQVFYQSLARVALRA